MQLIRETFSRHMEDVLKFWERAIDEEAGGFHVYVGSSGRVMEHMHYRSLTIQARQLYNYSEGLRSGLDFARRGGEHVYKFIREKLVTPDGWYTTIYDGEQYSPERMDTYDNMFAILGMGRWAEATGQREVMEEALRLFLQVEEMAMIGDDPTEGLIGSVNPSGKSSHKKRHSHFSRRRHRHGHYTGNANLHYLEAMAVLDHAFKAREEFSDLRIDFTDRVQGLRAFFLRYIYDARRHLTFDSFRDGFDQPYDSVGSCVSLAHGLEWVGFFRSFGELHLPEDVERNLLEKGRVEGLKEDGLFEDSFYLAENRTAGGGSFWPQVEAVLTFNVMAPVYGAPYYEAFRNAASYYFEHFVDPEGSVYMEIDRNGVVTSRLKGDQWKCDYHTMRMCVDVMERKEGALDAHA